MVAGSSTVAVCGSDEAEEEEENASFDLDDGHTCCPSVRRMRHCTSDDKCESDDDDESEPFSLAGKALVRRPCTGAAGLVDEVEEKDLRGKSWKPETNGLDLLRETDCFVAGGAREPPSTVVVPRT